MVAENVVWVPLVTVIPLGDGTVTPGVVWLMVRFCEAVSPATLVTTRVNVLLAVSGPLETPCPVVTEPNPTICPLPEEKTGVMVVDPP